MGQILQIIKSCSSWAEVQEALLPLSEKEKGDVFEELVKAFLLLDPEYASKLKHVWLYREVPQAVARKLKLPTTDKGIDLVAETVEGEFWAVQCKYRRETDQSLTWSEISTFTGLAFVSPVFSFGLVCSTTERITGILKERERVGFCALDVWQSLDAEFFVRLRAHLSHKPAKLKPLRPRPHQQAAVKDGHAHFVTGKAKHGKLIMPCGSGKSLTAFWIAEKIGARRIVVAVPSLALIRQTLKVWLRETLARQQAVEWICVCSDESAGRIERDDVAVLRQDLGVPCVTDPKAIAAWLRRKHRGLTVVFTTYQSGAALAQATLAARFTFDLGILDEAHKTVGDSGKLFSHLLHDRNLPIRRRLFMTATERRYQGSSDTVLSMDDPDTYGETFHLLSFKRAMEYHPPILSDYKIVSLAVSREEVANLIRTNAFVRPDRGEWNEEIEAQMLASLIALRKAMKKYPIRHAVSFHGSIQRAVRFQSHNDAFTSAFRKYGRLETFHVSGKTPTGTRARIIDEFARAEHSLITNARCLTEGVDVPGIDCVLFADPRRSAVDIVQAVGRALRPAAGKDCGYVILPILHEAGASAEDILDSDSFQEILTTLRALAAHDERIIEYFRVRAEGRLPSGGGGGVEFDIDERLAKRIDLDAFAREIELKCWDQLAKLSWRPFEEAREFVRRLKLKNEFEWRIFTKSKKLPADIPSNPNRTYADDGWAGIGDWLGNGRVANRLRQYRDFVKARAFTHSLGVKNKGEWVDFTQSGKLPADIPASPSRVYANEGWSNWGDWLGTGTIALYLRKYRPFISARAFARNLNLKNQTEWLAFTKSGKLPADIPANPSQTYASEGWSGMGDWLGTFTVASRSRKYRPFEQARVFARRLKLKNGAEWVSFTKSGKLPIDIPAYPRQTYAKQGWESMGDWLDTGTIAPHLRKYCSFEKARAFARRLKLKTSAEWIAFAQSGRLPSDIPAAPNQTYVDEGWAGIGDWLGTGTIASQQRKYRPFLQARAYARSLKLKSGVEWKAFTKSGKLPSDIPAKPDNTYAKRGWVGMGDWLGTGRIANQNKQYCSFKEARAFARSLKLKSGTKWRAFIKSGKLPPDIPATPWRTHEEKGWAGMGDWLGTGNVANHLKEFRSFREARTFVRRLKLKNVAEWRSFTKSGKLPADIPASPSQTYADKGWAGYYDWLGTR